MLAGPEAEFEFWGMVVLNGCFFSANGEGVEPDGAERRRERDMKSNGLGWAG
jgi:hypothetical protein